MQMQFVQEGGGHSGRKFGIQDDRQLDGTGCDTGRHPFTGALIIIVCSPSCSRCSL